MNRSLHVLFPILGVCTHAQEPQIPAVSKPGNDLTVLSIRKGLAEFSGPELQKLLETISAKGYLLDWSEQDIDQTLVRLAAIRDSDPYEVTQETKGGVQRGFPNRFIAERCIPGVAFQRTANGLRAMPLELRTKVILSKISNPDTNDGGLNSFYFGELLYAGKQVVPFILRYAPEYHLECSRAMMNLLSRFDDDRVAEYFINVLEHSNDPYARQGAAALLAKHPGDLTLRALVGALLDQCFHTIDRHEPQQPWPGHKPYIGRYYLVQHRAAESLSLLTGRDWGDLFNEDHQTWAAWMGAGRPVDFTPRLIERSDAQVKALIESFFHRRMSGRPNPWQPNIRMTHPEKLGPVLEDLRQLGPRVVPILVDEFEARILETPLWDAELRMWTIGLLRRLGWESAESAAESLKK